MAVLIVSTAWEVDVKTIVLSIAYGCTSGMSESDNLRALFEQARAENSRSLAKLLSRIETSGSAVAEAIPELITAEQFVFRVGITGPPGAGKSTLISSLIADFRRQDLRVAVLAIDPSSPFTRGAILGDRIRYSEHFLDPKVFIRSMGTRGSLGGLSGSAYLSLRAFDHMPFDIVLLETVGVGQTELEVVNVADTTIVTLVPESGDGIQAMKAGLSEIADVFIVNKADRPGADTLVRELEAWSHGDPSGKKVEVLSTVASQGSGVDQLSKLILQKRNASDWKDLRKSKERLQQEAKALARLHLEHQVEAKALQVNSASDLLKLLKQLSLDL